MADSITQAFVQQWDSAMRLQAQQKVSRLQSAVMDRGTITGESFTANRLAPLTDLPINNVRHGDTVWDDIAHSTRVALMQDYYQALPVDRADRPKLLANPNGPYQESLLASGNRRKDKIIYNALIGASQTRAGSLVNLPAGQIILNSSTGLTRGKIVQAKSILRQNEADEQNGEELYFIYNHLAMEDVLTDNQLTSSDFMAVKMLMAGDTSGKWMGFNWIPYQAVDNVSGVFRLVAFAKSALHFGTGFVEGNAQTRGDKKDTWQVSMAASYGAVRVEEEKVVRVDIV